MDFPTVASTGRTCYASSSQDHRRRIRPDPGASLAQPDGGSSTPRRSGPRRQAGARVTCATLEHYINSGFESFYAA